MYDEHFFDAELFDSAFLFKKNIFEKKKIKMFKWFEWTQVLQTYTELNENITGPSKEAIGERGSDAKPLNR